MQNRKEKIQQRVRQNKRKQILLGCNYDVDWLDQRMTFVIQVN
jgi:hypothetical protein